MLRYPFIAVLLAAALQARAAQQADDLTDALDKCQGGKADTILVYAHGSDWNPAGEKMLGSLWRDPTLAKGIPDSTVMVAVDLPEKVSRIRLRNLLPALPAPRGDCVSSVTGKNGTLYAPQADGSWLADPKTNPHHEVITMTFKTGGRPATCLRLQTLADPGFADGRSGRAGGNGHFAINETELLAEGGGKVAFAAAVADACENDANNPREAANVIDGDFTPGKLWSVAGADLKSQNLLLILQKPIPANTPFTLQIHCVSPWGQHTPGRLRLDLLGEGDKAAELSEIGRLAALEARNRVLGLDGTNLPAIYAYTPGKDRFGAITPIRPGDGTAAILEQIMQIQWRHRTLEHMCQTAQAAGKVEHPDKLVMAAEAMGDGLSQERRKEVLGMLLKGDPDRQDPWIWRFDFNLDSVNREKDAQLKAHGEQAALRYLDSVLLSPRAAQLKPEQCQLLHLQKFLIAKNWQGHEADKKRILEQMAEVAPETHLGIGARGQIDYFGQGVPTIAYGYWPRHVKRGENTLEIRDGLAIALPVSGRHMLTLRTRDGSTDVCEVRSAALLDAAGQELSRADTTEVLGPGKKSQIQLPLRLPKGVDPAGVKLRLVFNLPAGTGHSCTFAIKPALPEDGEFGWKK